MHVFTTIFDKVFIVVVYNAFMNMVLTLAVIIFGFIRIIIADTIKCDDSKSFKVSENEILFFESPNFPISINTSVKENCELKFTGNFNDEDTLMILVITNGYITAGRVKYDENDTCFITHSNTYFFTTSSSLSFFFDDTEIKGREAFQGLVAFELYRKDSCLFAERNEPIKFQNESEIFYFRSHFTDFYDENMVQRRCLWEFIADDSNFGLKLEILEIDILKNAKLYIVTNNTRGYVKNPSTNYYFDNYIAISYEGQKEAFEAKLSMYKLPKKEVKDECFFDNNTMTWKSDPAISYGNSINCLQTFNILPNHELHINTDYILNETGNALIFYSDSRMLFPVTFNETGDFVFLPNSNDTVRSLTFEYKSTENVINKKFLMNSKDISCECGPKIHIIPCTGSKSFSFMKDNNSEYCANISCTFEIKLNETCPNRYIDLNIIVTDPRNDYLSVKCGNDWLINTIHNSTDIESTQKDYKLLILPYSKTILTFKSNFFGKTQQWLHIAKLTMKTVSYAEPKYLPDEIKLSESLVSYTEQIEKHSVLTIKLSDELLAQKAVLELLLDSTKLKNIKCLSFYENRNLTNFKRIYTERILMEIGTSITVYKHNGCNDNEPIFVIRVQKLTECLFKNFTVVNYGNKPLSMIAGPKHTCKFHILNCAMSSVIKNIYTNSKIMDVVLFSEANERKELIRFNESTAKFFNQMTFNARSYVMEIPVNTSILIEPTKEDPSFTKPTFSYYETPKYGALNAERQDLTTTYNLASYLEAHFRVDDFDISSKGYLKIEYSGTVKKITAANEYFIINGKNDKTVKIFFADHEFGYRGALISITVSYTNSTYKQKTTPFPTTTIPKQDYLAIKSAANFFDEIYFELFLVISFLFITINF